MLNLVKNEIYKILHKKGTIIVLCITALFMVLISALMADDSIYYVNTELGYDVDAEDELQNKIKEEMNTLFNGITGDNWQYYVSGDVYDIVSSYYTNKKAGTLDETLEKKYNDYKEALLSDDWKFFVNEKLDAAKASLNEYQESLIFAQNKTQKQDIECMIFSTKVEIEMLEYRLKENLSFGSDYLNTAIDDINRTAYSVKSYEYGVSDDNKVTIEYAIKEYYQSRYILENKEDINNESDLRYLIVNFYENYIFLVMVFGIMIAGSIVSDEYNKGTIKSLLITPFKRSSILFAKFITVILLTLIFIAIAYFMQIVIGGIFLGFDSLSNSYAVYNLSSKSLEVMSLFKYVLINSVATLPQILLLVTLAFMASVVIGNTAVSIVIAFAGVIGAPIINMIASMYKIKILKYFVTINWNFNYYLFGGTSPYKTSLTHAIIVCIIYFLIMVITTFVVFNKKNIKNI